MKLTIGKSRDSGCTGKVLSYNVDLNTGNFQYIPDADSTNFDDFIDEYEHRYDNNVEINEEVF